MKKMITFITTVIIVLAVISITPSTVEASTDIYYQAPGNTYPAEGSAELYVNGSVDAEETLITGEEDSGIENAIQISADANKISTGGDPTRTTVEIFVSIVSTSEWKQVTDTLTTRSGLGKMVFEAEQTAESEDCKIHFQQGYNSGNENWSEAGNPDGEIDSLQEKLGYYAIKSMKGALTPGWYPGYFSTLEHMNYALSDTYDVGEDHVSGPGTAEIAFEADRYPGSDDLADTGEKSSHEASTMISWTIPREDWDNHTITISAKNIMRRNVFGGAEYEGVGAETSVDIRIRNAEIGSVESEWTDSGNPIMLSTANGEKYWDDTIDITLVNEPEDYEVHDEDDIPDNIFPIPEVDVTVDWGDDKTYTKSGWKPYDYDTYFETNEEEPTRSYFGEYIEKELSPSHTYDLDDLSYSPGSIAEFTITITVESSPGYGGWEMSGSYDISIEYLDNDDGGGGGGTPPPGGVVPTGNETSLEGG